MEVIKIDLKQIYPSQVEGECNIQKVQGIKNNLLKQIIYYFLSIITGFFFWLCCYWHPALYRFCNYDFCDLKQATHFWVKNWDEKDEIVKKENFKIILEDEEQTDKNQTQTKNVIGFTNRYLKYFFNEDFDAWQCIEFEDFKRMYDTDLSQPIGLQESKHLLYLSLYGQNSQEIPLPSYGELFMDEVLHPFFVFQMYSVGLWVYEEYYYYSIIIASITIVSSVVSLITIRQNFVKLRQMTKLEQNIKVVRNCQYLTVSTKNLVPGDVIILEENQIIPCDCVILQGNIMVNEASLTGESLPILKSPLQVRKNNFDLKKDKKHALFNGTNIIQVQLAKDQHQALAYVVRTAFSTSKGQLLRSILYPKPGKFKFKRQSMNFLIILFGIVIIGFFIFLPHVLGDWSDHDIAIKFLDMITIAVPPALLAALQVGIVFAQEKLKENNIFCIQPSKVVVGGRIDTICFDKTGTLTEDGMDLNGILPCINNKFIEKKIEKLSFNEQLSTLSQEQKQVMDNVLDCMSTCHSLIVFKEEIMGDPMESAIFKQIDGHINIINAVTHIQRKNVTQVQNEQKIEFLLIKRFDFSSETQCMSVIVQNQKTNKYFVFSKGAPEIMFKISDMTTIPEDFNKIQERNSKEGFRILGMAYKQIEKFDDNESRESIESNLKFLGLLLFENPLKKETQPTILKLNKAQIKCLVVSGDNPLTTIQVAKQIQLIQQHEVIYYCKFDNGQNKIVLIETDSKDEIQDPEKQQQTTQMGQSITSSGMTNRNSLSTSQDFSIINKFLEEAANMNPNVRFALTGDLYEHIFIPTEKVQNHNLIHFLKNCRIFSRMKPNQKSSLVEQLQKNNQNVAMVGDGANDCGALKQADIGLSLSDQEASISAPFTSKNIHIGSIYVLLCQCRAGLSTSFLCFKFIVLYSLIQYCNTLIDYFLYTQPPDLQVLYQDLFVVTSLFITVSLTNSVDVLTNQRPEEDLMSINSLISIFGQGFIQFGAQLHLIKVLGDQDFYQRLDNNRVRYLNEEDLPFDTMQASALFLFNNMIFIASVLSFSIFDKYKKPFYTNYYYLINIVFLLVYGILLIFCPETRIDEFKLVNELDNVNGPGGSSFYYIVFGWSIFWSFIIILFEWLVCNILLQIVQKHINQHYRKNSNQIETEADQVKLI